MVDPTLFQHLTDQPAEQWQSILESSKDKAFSQYGQDTNYILLKSTLDDARKRIPDPDFILYPGDTLAHKWRQQYDRLAQGSAGNDLAYRAFKSKATRFIAQQFRQRWPNVPILATTGNNDSFCGDYRITPLGRFSAIFAESWMPLSGKESWSSTRDGSCSGSDHFSIHLPTLPGHRLLVLNNVYWSTRYDNGCGTITQNPAWEQLTWLDASLAEAHAAGEKVWLLMHIPVGLDSYASIKALEQSDTNSGPVSFYQQSLTSRFARLITQYGPILQVAFAGHTHMDDFRLLRTGGKTTLLTKIAPAVCPVFGNNPAYQVYQYDQADGLLQNYQTYILNNLNALNKPTLTDATPDWILEYNFIQAYHLPGITPASVAELTRRIAIDETVRHRYAEFYDAGGPHALEEEKIHSYSCAITNTTPTYYVQCLQETWKKNGHPVSQREGSNQ